MKTQDNILKACNVAFSAETKKNLNDWMDFEKTVNLECIEKVKEKIASTVMTIPTILDQEKINEMKNAVTDRILNEVR